MLGGENVADKENIYGIKYEVDIDELKTSTAEATKKIKLANAEFKESSSKLDNWATSTDGLGAKIKQLNTVLEAEKSKLEQLKNKYNNNVDVLQKYDQQLEKLKDQKEEAIAQYGEESEEVKVLNKEIAKLERQQQASVNSVDKLKVSILNQQASINKTEKEIDKYNFKLNEMQSENTKSASSMDKLKRSINEQEKELTDLKSEYTSIILEQGKTSTEAQQLAGKIKELNNSLKTSKSTLNEVESEANQLTDALQDTGEEAKNSSEGFTVMKGALASLIANGINGAISKTKEYVTSVLSLSEATEEYRQMQAKITGSANSFGYSIDFAKERYKEFYSYLKDDQMATNAITNLMGMKVSTDTLTNSARGAIAVWASYGDSIPIEGLTESINESAQVAKVTGSLADAINWAKRSNEEWALVLGAGSKAQKAFNKSVKEGEAVEDAFSSALATCNSTQERADLIARVLNNTFGKSKETYDQLSGSIIDANREAVELKETQAELGESVQPLNTSLTKLKNDVLKELAPSIKKVSNDFQEWADDIDWSSFAKDVGKVFETSMKGLGWLSKNIKPVSALIAGLTVAWIANKNAQTLANTASLVTKGTTLLLTGVTKGATLATNAHTIATNAGTVAQKAFNLAQSATPLGLFTTLVVGATVAIGTYLVALDGAKNKYQENIEETQKAINTHKELIAEQTKAIETTNGEMNNVQSLSNELKTLADENGKVKEGYEARVKYILNELNSALGTEMELQNGVISKYKDTIKSIDDLIAKKRAEVILEAQLPAYKEAVTKATEAQIEASRREAEYAEVKKKNDKEIADLQGKLANASDYEARSIQSRIGILQQETTQAKISYEKKKEEAQGYYNTMAEYETNATRLSSENAEEWKKIETSTVTAKATSNYEKIQLLEQQKLAEEQHLQYLQEKYKGTNDAIELQQIESQQKKIQNIQNEINGMTSTVEGKTPEYVGKYQQMALKALSAFDGDTNKYFGVSQKKFDNVVKGLNSKDPEVQAKAQETAQKMLDKMKTNPKSKNDPYYQAGINTLEGVLNGTNAKAPSLWESMKSYGNRMLNDFKDSLGIKSPSRKFAQISQWIPEGIKKGVDKKAKVAINAVKDLSEKMLKEGEGISLPFSIDSVKSNLNDSIKNIRSAMQMDNHVLAGTSSNVNNVTFNQYNTSPKAIDSLETYRNTQKQLKLFKTWKGG